MDLHDDDDDESKTRPRIPIALPRTSNTMQRPHRPSQLFLPSPTQFTASSRLVTGSPISQYPKTAPCAKRLLPELAIQPATGSSLNLTTTPESAQVVPALSVSHRGSACSLSNFMGAEPPAALQDETEGSNETVRAIAPETSPFQQSEHEESSDDGSEAQPLNRYLAARSPGYGSIRPVSFPRSPQEGSRASIMASSVMHGVWLALQCCVFLLVFAVLINMTLSQSPRSDHEFWEWIWTVTQPILIGLTVSTFGLLIINELRGLSTVALLYLQSAILIVVTVTCFSLSAHGFEQSSVAVQAAVLSCAVTLWGWSVLSFLRVALLWRVESQRDEEAEYAGSFVS